MRVTRARSNGRPLFSIDCEADVHGMDARKVDPAPVAQPDDRFTLCLHLRSGYVQKTPYRSYAEAKYAADLFEAAAREANGVASPENVPFLYVFPPQGDVASVEIVEG